LGRHLITCDVGSIGQPDLHTLDALCRLQASARGLGVAVRLRHASAELRELVALSGLADVLPCEPNLLVPQGKAEQGEETRGVEEEGDARDPIP
jgi:hypothetical protein